MDQYNGHRGGVSKLSIGRAAKRATCNDQATLRTTTDFDLLFSRPNFSDKFFVSIAQVTRFLFFESLSLQL